MTLGGLTLAIGILVDESVVAVENIHSHLGTGKPVARSVLEASQEVVIPRLLAMLTVVSVFAPSFFMEGVARAMFVPLALAVGFSMVASYFLASSLVPILETWLNREGRNRNKAAAHAPSRGWFSKFQDLFGSLSGLLVKQRWVVAPGYLLIAGVLLWSIGPNLGTDIFPSVDTGQVRMRLRAPTGTRVERTERILQEVLAEAQKHAGEGNIETSIAFVGVQPSAYPVNLIYLWTSGPHEAVVQLAIKPGSGVSSSDLQQHLRERIPEIAPGSVVTFEAADLVSQVMSFGAPTPVEIAVNGPNITVDRQYAEAIIAELRKVDALRDVQIGELLDYPTVNITVDRARAAQLNVNVADVGRALAPATSSSRFTTPVYWADPGSGVAYQVQVEIPQAYVSSMEDLRRIPVKHGRGVPTTLGDVASMDYGTMLGEYHRINQQRMITVTANVEGADLGAVSSRISSVLDALPKPPENVTVTVRGQIAPMKVMTENLQTGLLLSIVAVFILLAAYFQSIRVALAVLMAVPAVLAGVAVSLQFTGTTLNIQSFMGAMMAVGISVANAILLCTFADYYRRQGKSSTEAAVEAARTRIRPVLMTSIVMIVGMLPLAMGSAQTAPLGIAVVGGLAAATLTTLLVIPSIFAILEGRSSVHPASIDPDDPTSRYFDGESRA
jgi:multidrug efflux pump subunit AcrB